MPRACVIVLDAVGVGALPDAADYGDAGSSTLLHVAEAVGGLELPNLQALGLGDVMPLPGCPPVEPPPALPGRLRTASRGKDTTIGHWEMMGIVTPVPMPTFPDGFPPEVVDPFVAATGRGVLGNVAASGTEIIARLGDEHVRTGDWILYTSADSVFQVAAHEEVVQLEELYDACRTARAQLTGPHAVGRVIARPFVGTSGDYRRTPHRHDFSLAPGRPNHLSRLRRAGATVHGVGKIADVFAGQDVDTSAPTASNAEGIEEIVRLLEGGDEGLVFANLVETDMIYGHRNDPVGFHACLQEFDRALPAIRGALREDDLLILCSDHGCDPTTPSTDHSREHALLLAHSPSASLAAGARHDGWLADVGATCFRWIVGQDPGGDVPGTPIGLA